MIRTRVHQVGGIALITLLAHAPVLAATAATNNSVSTCSDCTFVVDWNPVFECSDPVSGGENLVDCLLGSGPPGCSPGSPLEPQGGGNSQGRCR